MSEKLSGAPSKNEKQRIGSTSGIRKKRQRATVLASVLHLTCGSHELQPQENKHDAISMKNLFPALLHLQLYRTWVMIMTDVDIQCKQLQCTKVNLKIVPLV